MSTSTEPPAKTDGSSGAMRWAERWAEIEQTELPANLDAFLRDSVERYAERPLLDFFEQGRQVTYAELGQLVDRMAAALAAVGVGPGDRVVALMRSVPEFPATMFALARIGAVIVPTNFRYTAPEFEFVADDAGISAAVIADEFCEGLASAPMIEKLGPGRVVITGGGSHPIGTALSELPEGPSPEYPAPDLDTLVSLQYTSGTTGFPKGCMLTHRYWLEAMVAGTETLGPRYRILEDMPWFYMSGPISLMQAMANGGVSLIPDKPSLSRFLQWVHEQQVDFCWFATELLNRPETPLDRGHALKDAWVAGTTPEVIAGLRERFGVEGRECYGMTEIGIATLVPVADSEMSMKGTIGISAPFRELQVIDEHGDPLPAGEVGELCCRGAGILQGYYERPEANAKSFLSDGWFRTGDLARIDEQGQVHFLGRIKDTIRRSGENISSMEVEHTIAQAPGIAAVAALPVPDDFRGEEVKVYVVLDEGKSPDDVPPEKIFRWCEGRLATFKTPRYVEYRDELPKTASEKVAKGKLREEKPDLRTDSFDRLDGVWR